MHWNSDSSFPVAGASWCAWRPPFGRKKEGESAVKRAIWQWHPFDPILVSVPGAGRLLPPICFQELAPELQQRTVRQYGVLLTVSVCMALGFVTGGVGVGNPSFVRAGAAISLLSAFVVLQYLLLFRNVERLRSYARFCSWCHLHSQIPVVAMSSPMLLCGAIQHFLQMKYAGMFGFIERYGLVFANASQEPWRYLVGPFFHVGVAHWTANFILLVIGTGIAFSIGRPRSLWAIFLAGVYVPAFVMSFLPHWIRSDAFLGVSGGVFAIFGWIAGVALRNRRSFPAGLGWLMGYFGVATAVVASLLDPRASWFAHSTGLTIGVLTGLLNIGMKLAQCTRADASD